MQRYALWETGGDSGHGGAEFFERGSRGHTDRMMGKLDENRKLSQQQGGGKGAESSWLHYQEAYVTID